MNSISISNLTFHYQSGKIKIPIVKSLNLKIQKGDFVAIKGPSGSGKSTLLYLMAGLLKNYQGTISIDDKNIDRLKDLEMATLRNQKIGLIFQQFHLMPKLNVLENILFPIQYPSEYKKDNTLFLERAQKLMEELGLADREKHFPHQLSGGQQQRVAIARALINDPDIILADEPTGNLDSKSTQNLIDIFLQINRQGKTIVLITHESNVANQAGRILNFEDGKIINEIKQSAHKTDSPEKKYSFNLPQQKTKKPLKLSFFNIYLNLIPNVISNIKQNKIRTFLTMIGISVGIAAVCSMITLGNFSKEKILETYTTMGANTITLRGHRNWRLKAIDKVPLTFRSFNWEKEILPLKKIFPDIQYLSPHLREWGIGVSYGGKELQGGESQLIGISQDALKIFELELLQGRNFNHQHIARKHTVCIIGYTIAKNLFSLNSPLQKIIHIKMNNQGFACKVIGVLKSKTSNHKWNQPNFNVYTPFTSFQIISDKWSSRIRYVPMKLSTHVSIEKISQAITYLFKRKYGKSGRFSIDSDSLLLAQMNKFLKLFSILLFSIALVTLTVGGMGITNMMLISVSERLKEIGLRKSLGATEKSISYQFLAESILICAVAGLIGIILGFLVYQSGIYAASKFISKLEFSWIFDPYAIGLSLVSILAVGILSGIIPALKAKKLQVIDALRSD